MRTILPLAVTLAVLIAFTIYPAPPALGLTQKEMADLKKAGLSDQTLFDLQALHDQAGRTRKPDLTYKAVQKLLKAGILEDLIQLLIRLDSVSGRAKQMTISPDLAIRLKKAGVSSQTIRLMLRSEIDRASQGESQKPALGRKVVTRPDGKQVIIYYSGDPNRPRPSRNQKQEEELQRAWKLLEQIRIHIDPQERTR